MNLAYAEQYGRCFACSALVRDDVAMECRDCGVEMCEACFDEHDCVVPSDANADACVEDERGDA